MQPSASAWILVGILFGLSMCWMYQERATMPRINIPNKKRGNKFGAKRTVYNGWSYSSKAEAAYAQRLDLLIASGDVFIWLRQVGVDLGQDTRYHADFLVIEFDGNIYFVDVKGVETTSWKRTKKLWRKYGVLPLHVVKNGKTVEVIEGDG